MPAIRRPTASVISALSCTTAVPQAPSHVSEYRAPVVNDRGEVAFWAGMSDTIGVYTLDEAFVAGTSDNLRVAARSGQVLSSGESLLFQFGFPQLSRSGDMWISLPVTGSPELYATDQALLHSTSTGLELAIDSPSPSPDGNGTIRGIYNPTANDHGVVVSHLGVLTSPTDGFSAIAVLDDGELEYVARTDVAVPGVGSFAYWGMPTINNSRQVAFYAHIVGGTGRGLYSVENGGIREIARIGQPAATGNGNWEFLGWPYDYQPALNNAGQIAFSGHAAGHSGVFVDEAGQITEIIGTGQPASDGNGTVGSTALWGFNDAGQAAVQVSFNGTSGPPRRNFGHVDDSGIYRVSHDEATIVARTSMPTPDGTGYIERFHDITMNDVGHVVYLAEVSRNPGEFSVDHGIFITDGIDTVQVARRGQQLENHFVSNLTFGLGASHGTFHGENLDPSRRPVNNYGQVAYQAQTFVSGGHSEVIALFTPQLHWRIAGNGDWDDNANWTLSITPFEMHEVIIDPTSEIVIAGPAGDGAARSVSLGPAGSESATLQLDGSSSLRVGEEMSVGPNGALRFAAGAQLAAETVANDGSITGVGRILADVVNRLGVIAPGNSVGTLEIQGDFVQMSDAVLSLEIGDISDQLLIAGNALLGGTLAASFVSEFTPQLGDSFEILSAAGEISGEFRPPRIAPAR